MKELGAKLGARLRGGKVIELVGDVGAGKTTLTKGIAAGLLIDEDVQSPSFTISRVYDAKDGLRLAHYDFYRLAEPGIMKDELTEVVHDPHTITVVEWAGVVDGVLPPDHITITIRAVDESKRELTVRGMTEDIAS